MNTRQQERQNTQMKVIYTAAILLYRRSPLFNFKYTYILNRNRIDRNGLWNLIYRIIQEWRVRLNKNRVFRDIAMDSIQTTPFI